MAALAKFFIYNNISAVALEYLHEAHAMDLVRVCLSEVPCEDAEKAKAEPNSAKSAVAVGVGEVELRVKVMKVGATEKPDVVLARGVVVLTTPRNDTDNSRM